MLRVKSFLFQIDSTLYFDAFLNEEGRQIFYLDDIKGMTNSYINAVNEVDESEEANYSVYPSPSQGYISIGILLMDVIIFTLDGKVTSLGDIIPDEKINLEDFATGLYFLSGTNDEGEVVTFKFMVER